MWYAVAGLFLLLQAGGAIDRARELLNAGRLREAQEALSGTQGPGSDHLQALIRYKEREYVKAAELFERAVAAETKDTAEHRESVLLLGQSYYLANRFDKAIPWLEKAAAETGSPAETSYMLGNAYLLNGNSEKAESAFAKLFASTEGSAGARLIAAQMMVRNELWDPAERLLETALRQDPRLPEAHYLLGIAAIARGDADRSAKEFQKEIALNPNFAMAYYRLGDAYSRREELDLAIPQLQRAIWLNPNYSGPYVLLGKLYLKKKDYVNAEGVLRGALRLDPQNYSAHYLLGQTLMLSGRPDEARKIFDKAHDLRREQ